MDIRCPSCSKLFRVADEKISGKGIRFKCSKCAEIITITKDDFDMDLLAREAEATEPVPQQQPEPATRPSPQTAPKPSSIPVPPQPAMSPEPEAREYQPPQEHDIPPAALSDFDFSEPHAAATAAAHPEEGFGGQDFSFNVEPEQDAVPEVEISPEAAAEAEAALDFPVDLISEPTRKPVFGAPSASETVSSATHADEEMDLGTALHIPSADEQPATEPEIKVKAPTSSLEPPRTGPVFTPPPRSKPAPEKQDEEMDLGVALRIPQDSSSDKGSFGDAKGSDASTATIGDATRRTGTSEDMHPFASGNATGAVAGLGCAVPLAAFMMLGFGMIVKFLPYAADLPFFHLVAVVGTGIITFGVVIGLILSIAQALAGKKLFFLVNILIGTVFGAGFAVGKSVVVSLVSGSALNLPQLLSGGANVAALSFVISVLVVIARRIIVNEREETFSASLSGLQKAGLAVSMLVVLGAVYETGTFAGKIQRSLHENRERLPGTAPRILVTAEGLQVINAHGYLDPATGDLVISGSVQNTSDTPKAGWYLVTEVRDAKETVLATVRMVNGIQIFSKAEHDILARRGGKIEELQKRLASVGTVMISPKGSVPYEVRVMNPPAGSARFLPVLRDFDLTTLGEVTQDGMGRK
ncbi:MAG: zinc-ribbon domain-containing protein [Nitrospirota bacterium]